MPTRMARKASWSVGVAAVVCILAAPFDTFAQNDPSDTARPDTAPGGDENVVVSEETTETVTTEEVVEDKPLRGPKYLNLRYNEDFSYLDGPEGSYKKDFFDPIKWIHLDDNWTLSFGGSVRGRLESYTNPRFGANDPTQDTYYLWQTRLHADLRYDKFFRVFFEGIYAEKEDGDFPLRPIDENRYDIHQLFIDIMPFGEDVPVTARVGRQELLFGKQRLISPLAWANTRRRFDAATLFAELDDWDLAFSYFKPVPINLRERLNRVMDTYREEADGYILYTTYNGIKNHTLDLYFIGYRDTGALINANGRAGDLSLYTIGGRFGGKTGAFDYDAELAGQWGKFAGDTIHAWMSGLDFGYTFECPWKPRLGAGFDWGSGDKDPTDGTHDTFNQLFPLGHKYLGYMDLIGRENILATNVNLTFKPCDPVTMQLIWYTFWNDSKRDALYNAGGAPTRISPFGSAGHDLGNELDLTIKYQMDVHSSMLFGYSHFWPSNFIEATGPSEDADFLYWQYQFTF